MTGRQELEWEGNEAWGPGTDGEHVGGVAPSPLAAGQWVAFIGHLDEILGIFETREDAVDAVEQARGGAPG